uniref:Uncharacterized protein AlNc14C2G324 n=1 Tax=Albugo laibachii Nc14 TaxID=890382 RepID=F0VZI6_9STRA|nr:conserved hypothetical protein [Albugo laibachii Nc14]|eukprot:CCA14216.1 conserved hypothetical protein [Albugo laibachii Nc14]
MVQQPLLNEDGVLNVRALERELAEAIEYDRVYKRTDEVKKRAIHTSANYDEFKNRVACANMKPITTKELKELSKPRSLSTNLAYRKSAQSTGKISTWKMPEISQLQAPKTSAEFTATWNRYLTTLNQKWRYLQMTTASRIASLFQADIDADLMVSIVHVLSQFWEDLQQKGCEETYLILSILQAFTTIQRFHLTLCFLSNEQLEKIELLLKSLEQYARRTECKDDSPEVSDTRFSALWRAYGLKHPAALTDNQDNI